MASYIKQINDFTTPIAIELENHYIYGSQRIGINKNSNKTKMNRQNIHYELTNHLGNVMATIRGAKIQNASGYGYRADIVSTTTYGVFGNTIEEWSSNSTASKFGFNGKENIEEIDGWQDYGMRMYNRLIGRFPSPDPLIVYEQQYPELSSYQFASNTPIQAIDLDGLEACGAAGAGSYNPMTGAVYIGGGSFIFPQDEKQKQAQQEYGKAQEEGTIAAAELMLMQFAFMKGLKAIKVIKPTPIIQNTVKPLATATKTVPQAAKVETTVLGHYPAYTKLAAEVGAKRFNIPTNVWNKMTPAQQWAANQKFLDRMILRGDNIRLATPLDKVKPGSFYQKELNYLFDKGYKVSSDGLWLVK